MLFAALALALSYLFDLLTVPSKASLDKDANSLSCAINSASSNVS